MTEIINLKKTFKKTYKYLLLLILLILIALLINIFSPESLISNKILAIFSTPGENITIVSICKILYLILFSMIYFYDDIENRYTLIFSRQPQNKWVTKKLYIIAIMNLIFEIIFLIFNIILLNNTKLETIIIQQINFYIINIVSIYSSILMTLITKKNSLSVLFLIIIIPVLFKNFSNYFIILIIIIFILIKTLMIKTNLYKK